MHDLVIRPRVVDFRCERWQTPDGNTMTAPLPAGIHGHFGPQLHHALALGGADRGAEIGLARQAGGAGPAFRRVERNDVVAFLHRGHAGADVDDNAGALRRERSTALGADNIASSVLSQLIGEVEVCIVAADWAATKAREAVAAPPALDQPPGPPLTMVQACGHDPPLNGTGRDAAHERRSIA